ncbi:MAG TPA: PEP-utilizing enzyme [Solirubrobacteraceae bacterium]
MEPANPVHMVAGPATSWTTVNFAEAIQGVQKPLSWAMWSLPMETSLRTALADMGVLRQSEVPAPDSADARFTGIFFGRAAGNVAMFRMIGDRMPGSSADQLEEKLFGVKPSGKTPTPRSAYARYPLVAVKLPRAARRAAKQLPQILEEHRAWWGNDVLAKPPADLAQAQQLLAAAARRFVDAGVHHTIATLAGNGLLDQLGVLAERATGNQDIVMELATGYGAMEETQLIEDLWLASQERMTVDEVIARHGFHGPDEGDLSSVVWRERREPLEAILRGYRRGDVGDPRERERTQMRRREEAEARLLAGLPRTQRAQARLTLKLAQAVIPLREVGKAAFLTTLDAARCAARVAGAALVEQGALNDREDIWFLTSDEVIAAPTPGMADLAEERKQRHAYYETVTVPPRWSGPAEPIPVVSNGAAPAAAAVDVVEGIGVVPGEVTGRARVVHDPETAELDAGDILVCKTTDPSWTPLFMLVDALVIDTGGAASHGAIVARELGVTCVINTVTGTRDIPDGATIAVDGTSGRVEIRR